MGVAQINRAPEEKANAASKDFGNINPNAPQKLARFSFLIGQWQCDVKLKTPNGGWKFFNAKWTGRYILDGYVIADEFRMVNSSGKLVMLGTNYRTVDTTTKQWNMKWLEALSGTWLSLGPTELGGIQVTDSTITYRIKYQPGEIHRITFSDISSQHFTWSVDVSWNNGKSWNSSVMVIEATRQKVP